MKLKLVLITTLILLFFIPAQGIAADKWSKRDIWAEAVWQGLWAADYLQTSTIAKNPDRYWEANPLLTRHPSVTKVNVYFLTLALLHPAITHYLPKKHRPIWQFLSITPSTVAIAKNLSVGIKMDF